MNNVDNIVIDWDITLDSALDRKILENITKFHQSSTYLLDKSWKSPSITQAMYEWTIQNQYKTVIPSNYLEEIDLPDVKRRNEFSSTRLFDREATISKEELSILFNLLYNKEDEGISRRYPSAGALYPVIALLYVFTPTAVENLKETGVYIYNKEMNSLLLLKKWDEKELKFAKEAISPMEEIKSNLAMGYALDIRRSIVKYRKRGYRHGIIEIGLIAQAFRESLKEVNRDLGDLCWSGFNDNPLTYYSGLNVKLAPVSLIQWFGKRK